MNTYTAHLIAAALLSSLTLACGPTVVEDEVGSTGPDMSFDDFEAATYHEPWDDGVYIVNGDTPVEDEKMLREIYDDLYGQGELAVGSSGGVDIKWSSAQQRNLTYCVSDTFGSRKAQVIEALEVATEGGWETVANVDFIHVASQDAACTSSNPNVVFDVRPVSGAPYLARAFFPNQARASRNVLVDSTAFGGSGWPLDGILLHELGHALGFRHEHTRPEAGACFEDSAWRGLTPYDSSSVMHYPQCNGTGPDLTMSASDAAGAASLYGPPASSNPEPDPDPEPEPTGTPQSGTFSGQLTQGQQQSFQALSVAGGTLLEVSMTGTGDADLYVRFGSAPSFSQYDCRPYRSDANETCTIDVPASASQAHIMVHGYAAATFSLTARWTAP